MELLEEIKNDIREEKIAKFLANNFWRIMGAVIVVTLFYSGMQYYNKRQIVKDEQLTERLWTLLGTEKAKVEEINSADLPASLKSLGAYLLGDLKAASQADNQLIKDLSSYFLAAKEKKTLDNTNLKVLGNDLSKELELHAKLEAGDIEQAKKLSQALVEEGKTASIKERAEIIQSNLNNE